MADYMIDGNDCIQVYGLHIEKISGEDDLPLRKGETSFSWPDRHGVQVFSDKEDIVYDSRSIRIRGKIVGSSEANLEDRKNALKVLFQGEGLRSFRVFDKNYDISIHCPNGIRFIRIENVPLANRVQCTFEEPVPRLSVRTIGGIPV